MSWRSAQLTWLTLRWPRDVTTDQLAACFRMLASVAGWPVVLEATGKNGVVDHNIAVPAPKAGVVTEQLRAIMPGLGVDEDDPGRDAVGMHRAVRLRLSSRRRPLRTDRLEDVARALLTVLAQAGAKEHLVLQWVLGPHLRPVVVPTKVAGHLGDTWPRALLAAPWATPMPLDTEARSALRTKQGEAGWRAIGRIAVKAASHSRQRQLIGQILDALRAAEGPGASIGASNARPSDVTNARVPWRWPLSVNTTELAVLSTWPVGKTNDLPVQTIGSRPLAAGRAVVKSGRVLGISTWPGIDRPIALSPDDSLRHLHVLGPTGTGKSTLLLNLIVQDLDAGRGVVVIEPKGDLIEDVLARVPERRLGDVVLLDPLDEQRPVGLNPLAAHGRSPELVADGLLGVFHRLYLSAWGPRTQDILHASLLTLARSRTATLVALPLLLSDPAFRRRIVGKVSDPVALGPFWAGFEAWSEAERLAAVAPVMNKLRPFLMRPSIRNVIGQMHPKFDVRQVFTERKVLLVKLSKGRLGPEAASLLGSLVIAELWQAALERSAIDPSRRHHVFVYVDEFQDYLNLPTDLGDALAEARGLGVGLTLAHQHLHQLEPGMRSSVLANARSRVCFQLGAEDARTIAGSTGQLEPEDFRSLNRFEAYASLVASGSVQPWCSLRTVAPGRPTTDPTAVRQQSRERYGRDRSDIDADLHDLITGGRKAKPSGDDLSPRRRGGGS